MTGISFPIIFSGSELLKSAKKIFAQREFADKKFAQGKLALISPKGKFIG